MPVSSSPIFRSAIQSISWRRVRRHQSIRYANPARMEGSNRHGGQRNRQAAPLSTPGARGFRLSRDLGGALRPKNAPGGHRVGAEPGADGVEGLLAGQGLLLIAGEEIAFHR